MANLGTTFDANSVEPQETFSVIPAGKYRAEITASDMRPTKNGNGQYLWLEWTIIDGEYQGRKLFERLNLENSNQKTVEIAQRTLSAICHAVGKLAISDSEQLHYIPAIISVKVLPEHEDKETGKIYDISNKIQGVEVASAAASGGHTITRSVARAAAAVTPATNTAPWKRKTG